MSAARSRARRGVHPGTAIAAVGALALAVTLQVARDRAYPEDVVSTQQLLYVRSPTALGRIVLGFDAVAADVYWIRAIQHYGAGRLAGDGAARRYELLYPLLDITTSLDPYFNIAYRFGAIFLSEPYPSGAGRPDLAVALLRKGLVAQPNKWLYMHDIGFVHYWTMRDPQAAADWFRKAAALPDAPNWLLPVAAAMLTEGQDRASSRYIWQQMLRVEEDWLRKRAERALTQLRALDEIDELARIVAKWKPAQGETYSWPAIARAGLLRGIPIDPARTPYEIDPKTGEVRVSDRSPLFPMPRSGGFAK